jgi:indolepyruvate ferredoxin oxidoreductase, beta subunit
MSDGSGRDALKKHTKRLKSDSERVTNVLLVGVGGQGVLVASKILVGVLLKAGFDVKKSEVHGMAQRGGSVVSQVRFGSRVFSPLIQKGEGDILLSFEQLEALRYREYLSPDALVLINDQKVLPPAVSMGLEAYPAAVAETLRATGRTVHLVSGIEAARQAGNFKALNLVLLGVLSRFLPLEEKLWNRTLREQFPPALQEVNLRGFRLGRECSLD